MKGELVCAKGAVSLRAPVQAAVNAGLANSTAIPEDWRPRFADAYRLQNQAWVRAIRAGAHTEDGANAWGGYGATMIAEAGLRSLGRGKTVKIALEDKTALYR